MFWVTLRISFWNRFSMFEIKTRRDLRELLEGDGDPKLAGSDMERVFFHFGGQELELSWELKVFSYELSICWLHHANGATRKQSISFSYTRKYELPFWDSLDEDSVWDLIQEAADFVKVQEVLEK